MLPVPSCAHHAPAVLSVLPKSRDSPRLDRQRLGGPRHTPPRQVPGREAAGFQLAPGARVQTPLRNLESTGIPTKELKAWTESFGVSMLFSAVEEGNKSQ